MNRLATPHRNKTYGRLIARAEIAGGCGGKHEREVSAVDGEGALKIWKFDFLVDA